MVTQLSCSHCLLQDKVSLSPVLNCFPDKLKYSLKWGEAIIYYPLVEHMHHIPSHVHFVLMYPRALHEHDWSVAGLLKSLK